MQGDTGGNDIARSWDRRPRERRKPATREKILRAAEEFLEGGGSLADLTLTGIAREVGVHQASLYYYFGDKYELIAELMNIRNLLAEAQEPQEGEDFAAFFERHFDALLAQWATQPRIVQAGVDLIVADPRYLAEWRRYMESWVPPMARVARADPRYSPAAHQSDLEEVLTVFMWTVERNCYMLFTVPPWPDRARIARRKEALLQSLLASLGYPAAPAPGGPDPSRGAATGE
ncbi:TetR/AcrR family transcriptional regulator [Nocardiopsis mangrovi]|uniref:TetR/AcrR family transcriptional regulator n=1 Tax=Nocardiopsis mangrovi TaxID=1179818 RepID=A0ABV9DVX7_9ACTN